MLFPDAYYNTAFEIPFADFYTRGFRGIIFDIDNTLVEHDAPADARAVDLIRRLKDLGFRICIISNNKEPRVKPFAEAVGSSYTALAGKPKPGGYRKAMSLMDTVPENTIFVGDQIYTDILGGNLAGVFTILVKPMKRDPDLWIRIKRGLEWPVIVLYNFLANRKS